MMRDSPRKFAASALGVLLLPAAWLLSYSPVTSAAAGQTVADASPVVKITVPGNHGVYGWNSRVRYHIVVSYQGKSTEYQEIPSKEVLLRTTYLPDASDTSVKPDLASGHPPAGVLEITHATCLGCHSFKDKAMGPSFAAIGHRFPASQSAMDILAQNIRKGSTGVWGQESMPPQPELTADQLHAIVLWIVNDAANPNVNYYVGTEGSFRMEAPTPPGAKAGMLLTGSYTGRADDAKVGRSAYAEDMAILAGK